VDGRGPFALHPVPAHSTAMLNEAESRGVYRMAPVCVPRPFPRARPSTEIIYFVEEITVNAHSASVEGWAAIPGKLSERRSIHLMLRSETETHIFTTVMCSRLDVVEALKDPKVELSGFSFALRRDRLPTGNFQVGILIDDGKDGEYIMTAHRLELVGEGKGLLATGD
jgi:hypothetical protein